MPSAKLVSSGSLSAKNWLTTASPPENVSKIGWVMVAARFCSVSKNVLQRPPAVSARLPTRSASNPTSCIARDTISIAGTPSSLSRLMYCRGRLNRSMMLVKSPLTASRRAKAAPLSPSAGLLAAKISAWEIKNSSSCPLALAAGSSPAAASAISLKANGVLAARTRIISKISALLSASLVKAFSWALTSSICLFILSPAAPTAPIPPASAPTPASAAPPANIAKDCSPPKPPLAVSPRPLSALVILPMAPLALSLAAIWIAIFRFATFNSFKNKLYIMLKSPF